MSHRATVWAIEQRGLKPATKLVLWHLADRHNPDQGCFPSQERLAEDCEMSRSSLNERLAKLEVAGLIRRDRHLHGKTKRRLTTRYLLAFEQEFREAVAEEARHVADVEIALSAAETGVAGGGELINVPDQLPN